MRICERALNIFQVSDDEGTVRSCGWMQDRDIGNLIESSVKEIYHGEKMQQIRQEFFDNGVSHRCLAGVCPWISNGVLDQHMVEIDEVPEYPEYLLLAYEGKCNYRCTACFHHQYWERGKDWSHNYDIIEERLRELLPKTKHLSAHGTAELFCSNRILDILGKWQPESPANEIHVALETNGSLFDEEHWKKIQNLGKYNVHVSITVMSFIEKTYQYLSGTKLPIARLEKNLKFVQELREKGEIDFLELATVMQERNFREMPEFVEKCLSYGADKVRVRPFFVNGALDRSIEWFSDVRNPYHPYYHEYKEMIQDPIFPILKCYFGLVLMTA